MKIISSSARSSCVNQHTNASRYGGSVISSLTVLIRVMRMAVTQPHTTVTSRVSSSVRTPRVRLTVYHPHRSVMATYSVRMVQMSWDVPHIHVLIASLSVRNHQNASHCLRGVTNIRTVMIAQMRRIAVS